MPITQKTLDFLVENRLQDSRAWYQAHKEAYQEHVLAPLRALVEEITPGMLLIDPQLITEAKVDRTISRVYRDTRFSKDKTLYRDNCWIVFMRDKKLYGGPPAFYFDMGPGGFSYGCGYYMASPASLQCIRELILRREPAFQEALAAFEGQKLFSLEGEMYKRTRHPDKPEELRRWLDRKGFSLNCHSGDFELLFSDALPGVLLEGFRILAPIYRFFCAAEERRQG